MERAVTASAVRVTIFDWPEGSRSGNRLTTLLGMAPLAGSPTVVTGSVGQHLVWSGRAHGGLAALYRALGPALRASGLAAILADPGLEIFVAPAGEMTVLSASPELDATLGRTNAAVGGTRLRDQLERFASQHSAGGTEADGQTGDSEVDAGARRVAGETPFIAGAVEAVDFDLVIGSVAIVMERHDTDGFLEEAWVSCERDDLRTEFLTPGTCRVPGEDFDDSLTWRAAQWRWRRAVKGEAEDPGSWRLCGHCDVHPLAVRQLLPERLGPWVSVATQEAIDLCTDLVDGGDPRFADARDRLARELAVLDFPGFVDS